MAGSPPGGRSRLVLQLSEVGPGDRESVGNKAWYLSLLAQAGLPVPPALVIPREASPAAGPGAGRGAEAAPGLRDELRAAVPGSLRLGEGIAVRSSSAAEDSRDRSMAGQFLTILRVKGWDALEEALRACWSTCRAPGALEATPGIAVILQDMVEADLAGVAFSRDPLRAEGEAVAIEYCPGTAEHLVSAEIAAVRVRVEGEAVAPIAPSKPPAAEHEGILRQVADLARRIEGLFGFPVDVEWAAAGGRVHVIQARPITARPRGKRRAAEAPPGAWTRRIAEDLWADPLTSFEEGLLLSLAPRFDLRRWARHAGLAIPEGTATLGAIENHLFVSCDVLEKAVRAIPGPFRLAPMAGLFPPGRDPLGLPRPGALRVLRSAAGALFLGLTRREANPLCTIRCIRRRTGRLLEEARALRRADPAGLPAEGLAENLRRWIDLLARLLESNQFGYLYAVLFAWLAEHAARASGLPREAWLGMLGGTGENATRRMVGLLSELGRALEGSGIDIRERSYEEVLGDLERRGLREAVAAARKLLEEYGARAGQRTLIEPRWEERPLEMFRRAKISAGRIERGAAGAAPDRGKRPGFFLRLLIRRANRHLDLREDLRFAIDSVLLGIRKALLEAGRRSGLGDLAFFLFPGEAESLIRGGLPAGEARKRAEERFDRYRRAPAPPLFWVDGEAVAAAAGGVPGRSLQGVGSSPGIARGKVRIVERLEEAEAVERGEIVVAPLMGPAWAPILRLAGAVVTEKGGLLDHFAILAREAGAPAVTGAEGAAEALRGVEEATVDGANGTVTW